MIRVRTVFAILVAAVSCGTGDVFAADGARSASFRNDVMAAISKAGCNQGTCHGNARGKGGFQLSLRGQDPDNDYQVLTRDWLTRRTNVSDPDRSLLLLKPTMQVPHEGGRRFVVDSPEYTILRDWIARGCPDDAPDRPKLIGLDVSPDSALLEAPNWKQSLQARARFSDGSARDVTSIAVYDIGTPIVAVSHDGEIQGTAAGDTVVLVRYLDQQQPVRVSLIPSRPDYAWQGPDPANVIDEQVFARLKQLKLDPSPLCDDTTFLRRAYLDLIGAIPTAEEARAFIADSSPKKREALIDELLVRPEFNDWWALKWADMLRVEEKTLDTKGASVFHAWLRSAIASDMPLDQLVRELVAGRGSTYEHPEANFYRSLRDPFARSEAVGQLFLGVRLQCAKCHNHPFDRWTQNDYYAWGNVFSQVDYKILENNRRDKNDTHEFSGEQIVFWDPKGSVDDPRTNKPRTPKLLGEGAPVLKTNSDRLLALADWLTSPDNDRFAQMLANRAWRHLFGRGLVEPVDDFRATNPASHPELLQRLASELKSSGYRLRPLIRLMALSRTYQLGSEPTPGNQTDDTNYSHAAVRRLSAEQLSDGLAQACDVPLPFQGFPSGIHASQLPGVGAMLRRSGGPLAGDDLLRVFGRPPRLQSCECERSDETTLTQAFQLMSGELVQNLTSSPNNRASRLATSNRPTPDVITDLFWSTVSRQPTETELTKLCDYVTQRPNRTEGLQDILWSLVTSHEFLLRR